MKKNHESNDYGLMVVTLMTGLGMAGLFTVYAFLYAYPDYNWEFTRIIRLWLLLLPLFTGLSAGIGLILYILTRLFGSNTYTRIFRKILIICLPLGFIGYWHLGMYTRTPHLFSLPYSLLVIIVLAVILALGYFWKWRRIIHVVFPVALAVVVSLIIFPFFNSFLKPVDVKSAQKPLSQIIQNHGPVHHGSLKVLLIGIDGASWQLMVPLIADGKMPALKKLIDNGARGELQTFLPTESAVIWTSIATGVERKFHGIRSMGLKYYFGLPLLKIQNQLPENNIISGYFSFLRKHKHAAYEPFETAHRTAPAIWDIATAAGIRSWIINWWVTWPVYPINGIMVSDCILLKSNQRPLKSHLTGNDYLSDVIYPVDLYDAYSKNLFTPEDIDEEITRRFVDISLDKFKKQKPKIHWTFTTFYAEDRTNVDFVTDLTEKTHSYPPLAMIYLQGVDTFCHAMLKYTSPLNIPGITRRDKQRYGKAVGQYYKLTDKYIARLVKYTDENTVVMILSDHGFEYEKNIHNFDHRNKPPGVIIMSGKPVRNNMKIKKVSVFDIMPTMLYMLGLPVGSDMPGRILEEVFTGETKSRLIKTYLPSYGPFRFNLEQKDAAVGKRMIDQLKSLGYLE